MSYLTPYLQYYIALIAVLNPIGNLSIFIGFTANLYNKQRSKANLVVAGTICIVLIASILFGQALLNAFAISIEAFKITGGILLSLNALNMLKGNIAQSPKQHLPGDAIDNSYLGIMVVPLSIPLLAGPGSISTAIVWAQNLPGLINTIYLIIASCAIGLTTWLIFSSSNFIIKLIGTLGTDVISKISALIIFAIGVEFVISALAVKYPILLSMIN